MHRSFPVLPALSFLPRSFTFLSYRHYIVPSPGLHITSHSHLPSFPQHSTSAIEQNHRDPAHYSHDCDALSLPREYTREIKPIAMHPVCLQVLGAGAGATTFRPDCERDFSLGGLNVEVHNFEGEVRGYVGVCTRDMLLYYKLFYNSSCCCCCLSFCFISDALIMSRL
jgi:hypothetical protein